MMQQAAKLRSPSGRKLTTGLAIRISRMIRKISPPDEQDQERLHAPERIAQPVPLLPLAEHDFPRRHREGQQAETDVVEIQRLLEQLGPLGLEVIRIVEQKIAGDQRPACRPAG